MIYFDNAATSFPKPTVVREGMKDFFHKYGANPGRSGHTMSLNTAFMVYECRDSIAKFFNAYSPEDVVFTSNCTQATNIVIKGLLSKGSHVIISNYEHNAVLRPIHKMYYDRSITYDVATVYEGDPERTIESFRSLIKKNTVLIISIHASNVFGITLPVKEIAEIAHKNNAMFMLDAAQSAGVLPIDMQEMGIDFLCAPGHKSLYGPSGTGFLITNYGQILNTTIEGGTGSLSRDFMQPNIMPDKLESGTLNTLGILGLSHGIDFINKKGMTSIYNHEMKIIQRIYERISQSNKVELYTDYPQAGTYVPVLSFNIKDMECDDVIKILDKKGFALRGGIHCSLLAHKSKNTLERGTARISVGAFNNFYESDKLCIAILSI